MAALCEEDAAEEQYALLSAEDYDDDDDDWELPAESQDLREVGTWLLDALRDHEEAAENALRLFEQFDISEWADWMESFLADEPCEPEVFGESTEPHLALRGVFHSLESGGARRRFVQAIAVVYEATAPLEVNAEQLHHIIRLIDYLKPRGAKYLVEQDLFTHTFADLYHEGQSLHTALLVARGRYGLDDTLVEFIYNSSRETDDFGYLLAGLQVLAARGTRAYNFLGRFIPHLEDPFKSAILSELLPAILSETGYRPLYVWYAEKLAGASGRSAEELSVLEDYLEESVLPEWDAEELSLMGPYPFMMSALLRARRHYLSPAELLSLARLHGHFENETPVVQLLDRVYVRISGWSSHDEPWIFEPFDDYRKNYMSVRRSVIEVGGDLVSYNGEAEQTVELIFHTVRNRYEPRSNGRATTAG